MKAHIYYNDTAATVHILTFGHICGSIQASRLWVGISHGSNLPIFEGRVVKIHAVNFCGALLTGALYRPQTFIDIFSPFSTSQHSIGYTTSAIKPSISS